MAVARARGSHARRDTRAGSHDRGTTRRARTMTIPDELKAWRKQQRAELIARRVAMPADERTQANERITAALIEAFAPPADAVVGFCWPFKNEFDSRFA